MNMTCRLVCFALITFTYPAYAQSLCQRTPAVREALIKATCKRCACEAVTAEQLTHVEELPRLSAKKLAAGDFAGLTRLRSLDLSGNPGLSLPSTLPAELPALLTLRADSALLVALPDEVVNALADRAGFAWQAPYPGRRCDVYHPKAQAGLPQETLAALRKALPTEVGLVSFDAVAREGAAGGFLVASNAVGDGISLYAVSKDMKLTAQSEPLPLDSGCNSEFDLASYRLTDKEIGIGVRRTCDAPVPNNASAAEEQLMVLHEDGGHLKKVFSSVVYRRYTRAGPPTVLANDPKASEEDWSSEETHCAVVSIAHSVTRGHLNWFVIPSDAKGKTRLYRWNGKEYPSASREDEGHFFGRD